MKRILIVSLAVVLVVVMMAVPAFAMDYSGWENELLFGEQISSFPIPDTYVLTFTVWETDGTFIRGSTEPFVYDPDRDGVVDPDIGGEIEFVVDATIGDIVLPLVLGFGYDSDLEVPYLYAFLTGDDYDLYGYVPESFELIGSGQTSGSLPDQPSSDSIFAVFAGVGTWLVAELGNVTTLFYQADTGLTLLGVLAVCGLGFAVIFLLISWIRNLLQFRS